MAVPMWSPAALQANMIWAPGLLTMFWYDKRVIVDGSNAPLPSKISDKNTSGRWVKLVWKIQIKEQINEKVMMYGTVWLLENSPYPDKYTTTVM